MHSPMPAIESVWIEPPDFRPPAMAVPFAPPAMLVQRVPTRPFASAIWIGGYWIWQRRWVWAQGMWSAAPRSGVRWAHPCYDHRNGLVIFVAGHWADDTGGDRAPLREPMAAVVSIGTEAADGFPPVGPEGRFVPAPPGSTPGLIVPAPLGTAPAVVTGAPPVSAEGMRVIDTDPGADGSEWLSVTAPPGATTQHCAVRLRVPVAADRAAALTPVVRAWAPMPRSELSVRYVASPKLRQVAATDLAPAELARQPSQNPHALRASA
jgi:hypothetical protein